MDNKIYVGDIGTEIILDALTDISSQTVLQIKYKKPDKTTGFWPASVQDTTKAKYVTAEGDLDQAGTWQLQIYVELSGGWKGHGEATKLVVSDLFR